MILDRTRPRRALTRRFLLTALGVGAAALVPLAMLRPAARAQAADTPLKHHMTRATARVSAVHAVPGEFDAMQLVAEGRALTPHAAADLERALTLHPDDYAAHIRLLGYYQKVRFIRPPAGTPYQRQVFWFIRNHPESVLAGTPHTGLSKSIDAAAFEEGRDALAGAGLQTADQYHPPRQSRRLLRTLRQRNGGAAAAAGGSPGTERRAVAQQAGPPLPLAGRGRTASAGDSRLWAQKALAEYEAAAEVSTNKTLQHSTSADLAVTAFDAGDYDKAHRYAADLLLRGQNKEGQSLDPSDDLHHANLILGLLALRDGDTAGAEAHLLAMGRVSGSPVLGSFGPNMRLAQELLKAGRREAVLAYFDECAKFWAFDRGAKLKQWKSQVKKGEVPDFGGNLVY